MIEINVPKDNQKTLLEILREENHYLPAVCAGRGTCGKCRVKIIKGEAAVTDADRSFFDMEELRAGWRLACKCTPKEDLTIDVSRAEESSFDVLGIGDAQSGGAESLFGGREGVPFGRIDATGAEGPSARYVLGIDIGTTTIAMALQDMNCDKIIAESLSLNHQRMYGADVISRIQASVEGKGDRLQALIRQDLLEGIQKATGNGALLPEKIVIAANTTMIHLLMGYPCDGLGQYPFTPYHIDRIVGTAEEILGGNLGAVPIHILPGISTFVGADIVADMLVCDMHNSEGVNVLIDVGTNGEMAIGNRDRILVTSTAAGPAFEGGNISCGIGSVPGAICEVELSGGGTAEHGKSLFGVEGTLADNVRISTIQNAPPVGICGTGTIEIIYELLKAEIMDETGYMEDEEFVLANTPEGTPISFTQKDVRQLQLAKAALRAGVETLLLRYGVTADEVDRVYLAGGFGYHINLEKAFGIGLFPEGFRGKIELLGNGALQGALLYGIQQEKPDYAVSCEGTGKAAERIAALSREVSLAADKDFNELYLEYMSF